MGCPWRRSRRLGPGRKTASRRRALRVRALLLSLPWEWALALEQVRAPGDRRRGRGGERGARRKKERREHGEKREASRAKRRIDRWPMRHRAGDDVGVVSRPSLTKSLGWLAVRPRSPGWTRSSSFTDVFDRETLG